MRRKIINLILRLIVSLGLITYIFKFVPYKSLLSALKHANLELLALGFACFFLAWFICVIRWRIILKYMGVSLTFNDIFTPSLCGTFFNLFFPSLIAGDIFRGIALRIKYNVALRRITASLIVDRTTGFIGLSLTAIVSFLIGLTENIVGTAIILPITLWSGLLLIFSVFLFSRRASKIILYFTNNFPGIKTKLERLYDVLHIFRESPKILLISVGISLPVQAFAIFSYYITALGLGIRPSLLGFFIIVPIISIISLIPITIAGLGSREGASVYFMGKTAIAKPVALGISLMNFVYWTLMGIIGGILYVMVYNRWLQRNKTA